MDPKLFPAGAYSRSRAFHGASICRKTSEKMWTKDLLSKCYRLSSTLFLLMWQDFVKIAKFVAACISVDCEQSFFCSKIRGEKVGEHESRSSGETREALAAGDERKERLQWFHTTIVNPGTLVTE